MHVHAVFGLVPHHGLGAINDVGRDFFTPVRRQAVPMGLCDAITPSIARMRGTDYARPRCAALTGTIGTQVACGIYEWRPSPCDELQEGSAACNQARSRHGLPDL